MNSSVPSSEAIQPPASSDLSAWSIDDWDAAIQRALERAANGDVASIDGKGRRISLKQQIWKSAPAIIALKAEGRTYQTLAQSLRDEGIEISGMLLAQYIAQYRKQQAQLSTPAQTQQHDYLRPPSPAANRTEAGHGSGPPRALPNRPQSQSRT